MLQSLRELAKSWVFKALMMLLIISFGIWGIGDMFRGNPLQRTVAKVGKIAISVQALEREFQTALPEARQIFGPDLTAPKAREIGVLDRSLKIMMEHASFDQETKRLGINVGDKAVMDKIAAQPELRDERDNFKADFWRQALAKSGYTERSFVEHERKNAERRLMLQTMINDVAPPKILVEYLYRARGAKRVLEVLSIKNDGIKNIALPDDKALQEFHGQHADWFSAPEYRALTIVSLSPADVKKGIVISEEDLKKAYDTRPDESVMPEQRDFVQVIAPDETRAKAFAEAVKAGGDFAATAKSQGLNAVDLNRVEEKSVLPELYTTLFALEEKQVSEPVKSSFGWHVVMLKKIYEGGKLAFDEAKEKLRATLQEEVSADTVARMVNQLDDSLAANHPLEETADSMKLRLVKIPAVDATGKTPENTAPDEIAGKEDLLKTAFGLAAGETSQVFEDKDGSYYIVRTDDVQASHVLAYEDIKDMVAKLWLEDQQRTQAIAKAEGIAKELRDGGKVIAYASKPGIEVRFSKPISMLGEDDPDLPANAFPLVMKMKKGDVITLPGTDRQFVLRLADIVAVDPAKPDDGMDKVVAQVKDKRPFELVDAYSWFLRTRFPFRINEELLSSLRKQGG